MENIEQNLKRYQHQYSKNKTVDNKKRICLKLYKIKKNKGIMVLQQLIGNLNHITIFDETNMKRYEGYSNSKYQYEGKGKLWHSKDNIYEGTFENGEKKYGKNTSPNQTFEGLWKENHPLKGTLTFSNGEQYTGDFLKGIYEGRGIYRAFKDEKWLICKGQWTDGKRDGEFEIINEENNNKMKIVYDKSYIEKIQYFQGNLNEFGYTKQHLQLFNLYDLLPEVKFTKSEQILKKHKQDSQILMKKIQKPYFSSSKLIKNKNKNNKIPQKPEKYKLNKKFAQYMVNSKQIQQYEKNQDLNFECPICIETIQHGDMVKCFPCQGKHIFHSECLKNWKQSTCPQCRFCIKDLEMEDLIGQGKNIFLQQDIGTISNLFPAEQPVDVEEFQDSIEIEQQSSKLSSEEFEKIMSEISITNNNDFSLNFMEDL